MYDFIGLSNFNHKPNMDILCAINQLNPHYFHWYFFFYLIQSVVDLSQVRGDI